MHKRARITGSADLRDAKRLICLENSASCHIFYKLVTLKKEKILSTGNFRLEGFAGILQGTVRMDWPLANQAWGPYWEILAWTFSRPRAARSAQWRPRTRPGKLFIILDSDHTFENKKYTAFDCFHGQIRNKKEPIRTLGFSLPHKNFQPLIHYHKMKMQLNEQTYLLFAFDLLSSSLHQSLPDSRLYPFRHVLFII